MSALSAGTTVWSVVLPLVTACTVPQGSLISQKHAWSLLDLPLQVVYYIEPNGRICFDFNAEKGKCGIETSLHRIKAILQCVHSVYSCFNELCLNWRHVGCFCYFVFTSGHIYYF